jgi:protein TonB
MFKVLTGEKKRRVISPATITASVAAHLLLLGGLVYASTGDNERVEVVCLDCGVLPPLEEAPPAPPPPPVDQPTPPAPTDEPKQAPVPGEVLEVERVDSVPKGIPDEQEGVEPVNVEDYRRDGRPGDIIGPRTTEEPRPPTGETIVPTRPGPIPEFEAEVRPVLQRSGLSRILERHYPPVLRDARVSGRVVIELVVDEEGVPVEGSARVIEASHPAFGEAALRAVDRFRFSPARIGRTPIPVVVTIPIQWTVPN